MYVHSKTIAGHLRTALKTSQDLDGAMKSKVAGDFPTTEPVEITTISSHSETASIFVLIKRVKTC
jgi:hypothetical protein